MVGKKIKNPNKSASKATRIGKLSDYIVNPEREDKQEKCIYSGSRGFVLAEDHDERKEEMLALATACVRSPDPITHYAFSWQAGERPSPEQIEELIDKFEEEMGVKGHQIIYGLHADTDNYHLHVELNRVSPVTEQVVEINKGYDIEVCHYIIQQIEELQGWAREDGAAYRVRDDDGKIVRIGERNIQPSSKALEFENRTGERSAERIAQQEAAPVILSSRSWGELHERLGKIGIRFVKEGSGAKLQINNEFVKASRASRACSLNHLEQRLGPFQPAEHAIVAERKPEPAEAKFAEEWALFRAEKEKHDRQKEAVKERQRAGKTALSEKHAKELADIDSHNWRGKELERELLVRVVEGRHAQEVVRFNKEQRKEYGASADFPDFVPWLEQHDSKRADQWRHRHPTAEREWGVLFGSPKQEEKEEESPAIDLSSFSATVDEKRRIVIYTRRGQTSPAFIDLGKFIDVRSSNDEGAILAAMQLAAQRWEALEIKGSPEFARICTKLAAQHGFKIANPELQQPVLDDKARTQENRGPADAPVRAAHSDASKGAKANVGSSSVKDAAEAFERHKADILQKNQAGKAPNPSRLDWMIAVRMRATGHPLSEVERLLKMSAEARPQDHRDCANYAKKTATQAYGERGKRELERFAAYHKGWLKLEGRTAHEGTRKAKVRSPRQRGGKGRE
jgi:hypothetical protein